MKMNQNGHGQAPPLRMDAPTIHELLALAREIRERVRNAPPGWQHAWAELEQDIVNVQRAIEMSRWGHGKIDAELGKVQERCEYFHRRLCQECPNVGSRS